MSNNSEQICHRVYLQGMNCVSGEDQLLLQRRQWRVAKGLRRKGVVDNVIEIMIAGSTYEENRR